MASFCLGYHIEQPKNLEIGNGTFGAMFSFVGSYLDHTDQLLKSELIFCKPPKAHICLGQLFLYLTARHLQSCVPLYVGGQTSGEGRKKHIFIEPIDKTDELKSIGFYQSKTLAFNSYD